jgi:hypothetical protein
MNTDTTTTASHRAHARVGAAAGATFLALLVLGLLNTSAGADEPAAAPRSAPSVQQQPQSPPSATLSTPNGSGSQSVPGGSGDGQSGDGQSGGGFGFRHRGGDGSGGFDDGSGPSSGGGAPSGGFDGGGAAAPSAGGSTT